MAIQFKEEALPNVAAFPFDITHWGGVNKNRAAQSDWEMSDCKNMSIDKFPYASPRPARKKVVSESGIKRIYKVEDGKIYCIDSQNRLCYFENGVKTLLTYDSHNGTQSNIYIYNCLCSNNYDKSSIFYPEMAYTDYEGKYKSIDVPISFEKRYTYDSGGNCIAVDDSGFWELQKPAWDLTYYTAIDLKFENCYIKSLESRSLSVVFELPDADYYHMPYQNGYTMPEVRARIYNKDGHIKSYSRPGGYGSTFNSDETYQKEYFSGTFAEVKQKLNRCDLTIPDEITLEKGDYIVITVGIYSTTEFGGDYSNKKSAARNVEYIATANWYIGTGSDHSPNIISENIINYGVVYNNRIVGVRESDIRASALGDFSNFFEYADEAGNASATGAYATDVGSAGDFTGICAYKSVLLLFKKNIVYEMYGSMPYSITELCSTGCIDNDSICEIDGALYWASPKGIVRYSGGAPTVISDKVGIDTSSSCKAGTDGRKYYVYDGKMIYVYDTWHGVWHIEDGAEVRMYYSDLTDLYVLLDDGIYLTKGGDERVEWEFETKDFTFSAEERKNLSKLWVRAEMEANSAVEIYVRQDGGEWKRTAVKTAEQAEMFDFKLRVKKCDSFALKFKGRGNVRILDIHGKVTVGTSKHRSGLSLNVYRR